MFEKNKNKRNNINNFTFSDGAVKQDKTCSPPVHSGAKPVAPLPGCVVCVLRQAGRMEIGYVSIVTARREPSQQKHSVYMCPDPFPFSSTSVLSPSPCCSTTKSTSPPSSLMRSLRLTNGSGLKHSANIHRMRRGITLKVHLGFLFTSVQFNFVQVCCPWSSKSPAWTNRKRE